MDSIIECGYVNENDRQTYRQIMSEQEGRMDNDTAFR